MYVSMDRIGKGTGCQPTAADVPMMPDLGRFDARYDWLGAGERQVRGRFPERTRPWEKKLPLALARFAHMGAHMGQMGAHLPSWYPIGIQDPAGVGGAQATPMSAEPSWRPGGTHWLPFGDKPIP